MRSTLQPSHIGKLPAELDLTIGSYLDVADLGSLGAVNKEWNILANDKTLWAKIFPELVEKATLKGLNVKKYIESFHATPVFSLNNLTNRIQRFVNKISLHQEGAFEVLTPSQGLIISAIFGSFSAREKLTETYVLIDPVVESLEESLSLRTQSIFPRNLFHSPLFIQLKTNEPNIEEQLIDIQLLLVNRMKEISHPIRNSIKKVLRSIKFPSNLFS